MATTVISGAFQEPTQDIKLIVDTAGMRSLEGSMNCMSAIETSARIHAGAPSAREVPAIALESKVRDDVHKYMKRDSKWQGLYQDIMDTLGIGLRGTFKQQVNGVYLPDWNAITAGVVNLKQVGENDVHMELNPWHSYASQAMRRNPELFIDVSNRPLSVYGVVLDKDGAVMMGVRTGKNLGGGLMTLPAGSLYALKDENGKYVLDPHRSIVKELIEETGLKPGLDPKVAIEGVIGLFHDSQQANFGVTYLVRTNYTQDELKSIWNKSPEHSEIFFVSPRDIPGFIMEHADRREKPTTDIDPNKKLVHSGVATLLTHLFAENRGAFDRVVTSLRPIYDSPLVK